MRPVSKLQSGAIALALATCCSSAVGDIINELADAGDMPVTAQFNYGGNPLDKIVGTLSNHFDADMYAIRISDPAAFSATSYDPATAAYDTQLFLFDSYGRGVVANDDISHGPYNPRSRLIAGSPLNPTVSGVYFLAISGWDKDPHSTGGAIFNDDSVYVGTVGATGPGGGLNISGWDGDGGMNGALGAYTIRLTGASFVPVTPTPEPSGIALLLAGAALMWSRTARRGPRVAY